MTLAKEMDNDFSDLECPGLTRSLPSKETLKGHSDSSFRGEGYIQCCVGVRLCDMYLNQELAEIHFMCGKADGNAALFVVCTRREYTPLINRQHIHFLHDGAPAHFSRTALRYLDRRFPDRWIGRSGPIAWPPRSPDLNPLDFYLWGHLKSLVYSSPVPDLESLRNRIVACSDDIRNTRGVWGRVRRSMRHRCEVCIQAGGDILNIFCNDNDLRKEKRSVGLGNNLKVDDEDKDDDDNGDDGNGSDNDE
ncbi:hypothetical protein ANN_00978 [Periplaneta americana]|uniref:Transposase n=1 Tax=Periplaneta americana TaxID=6978 RepID=A0ABQ8TSA5_PERAM|nr:hypothetical protein ANN_00978 [Periplaneta americana]